MASRQQPSNEGEWQSSDAGEGGVQQTGEGVETQQREEEDQSSSSAPRTGEGEPMVANYPIQYGVGDIGLVIKVEPVVMVKGTEPVRTVILRWELIHFAADVFSIVLSYLAHGKEKPAGYTWNRYWRLVYAGIKFTSGRWVLPFILRDVPTLRWERLVTDIRLAVFEINEECHYETKVLIREGRRLRTQWVRELIGRPRFGQWIPLINGTEKWEWNAMGWT